MQKIKALTRAVEQHRVANITIRTLLATLGGYGLALLGAALLAKTPFSHQSDAVSFAIMLGFTIHLVAIIWVFATATLSRAFWGLALPALLFWLALISKGVF